MGLPNEEYGRIIRIYRGRGKLKLKNGNELSCHIIIQQVETGLIYITCKLSPQVAQDSSVLQFLMNFSAQDIENIHGTTKDGMCFRSQGKLLLINSAINIFSTKSSRLRLLAQGVELWTKNRGRSKFYKFSVVNFEFTGNNMVKRIVQDGSNQAESFYSNLVLKTYWGIATVNPVPDYDYLVRRVTAQRGISVTCEIDAKPSVKMEMKKLTSKMDELCRLLSLSRGTKITWINAEEYMGGGKTCAIILRNAVTWPFSSLPLIDPREPSDTPLFIEKVYPTYLILRDSYNLDIAIEQYLDAKRETAYLETRALAAVSLLDFLQGRYTSPRGLSKIVKLSNKEQGQIRLCLKGTIESLRPNINEDKFKEVLGEDTLQEMMEKTSELNRRSYLNVLKLWVHDLKLDIPEAELSEVKRTRHALVHNAKFRSTSSEGKTREYFRVVRLINQVFLKLLDYDGYFIDINLNTLQFERHMFSHNDFTEQQNIG